MAEFVTRIRTEDGDKQIDYNALANLPDLSAVAKHTHTPESIGAAPAEHTHTRSEITDFPTSLPANGGNADTLDGKHADEFVLTADIEEMSLTSFGVDATAEELNYVAGVTSDIQAQLNGKSPYSHRHSATDIVSGALLSSRGGTGNDLSNIPIGAVICKHPDNTGLWYTEAVSGAFYAPAPNTAPQFGVLPIPQGGIGSSDGATGLKNLFAAGYTILSPYQFGTTLEGQTPIAGRLFFVKANKED
jgi:hypothetical protein